ncbi:TIGR04388 family protein [Leptospira meyeri]|uniref:TIGR04388 family protein n=1 Tax=Leptospira meyeri TaxID=29508 RepID=UPI000C2B35EC|nr:TIGR04388 family protein [Leptospira meyeri]PJZ79240.1 hypothetical protein CH359_18890 [Leptospira meyeri]PJZ95074.1 hypothetical protein CH358_18850 [Leptospira meyeri]
MKNSASLFNNFDWISLFWKRSNQRYTSAVLIFTYCITFFTPILPVYGQATVPVLNSQQFQGQDMTDIYALADQQATSVEHWDALVNSYLYNLYTDWQLIADAKIAEYVAAVTTSDAYNSVQAYKDYVYQGLQSQKAIQEQNWMSAAETSIQLRRETFLASNTSTTYNSVEVNSTQTQTNLGNNPNQNAVEQAQEAVRIAREQWEREHAAAVANGLFQYENAIDSSERTYNNLVSQVATTEAQFLTQLANLRNYETTVRNQIGIKVNQLQTYLATNSVFYETDANGSPIIDNNHLTSDGQNLKTLMSQMQDAIANKSSLTTISGMLKDYLAAQESVAAANHSYWNGKVYNSAGLGNTIFGAQVGGNYLSNDVISAIKTYYDSNDLNGLKSFINGKLGLNTNYKYVQTVTAADMVGSSSNYSPYPVTLGGGGYGENYSSNGNAAFSYWATGCGFWGTFLCVTQEFQEESIITTLNFTIYDSNAASNATAWGNYSTSLDGMVTSWESSVIPAISNWESQVSLYESEYAAWKAQSVSVLAEAAIARDSEIAEISESRANWLSKMNSLQQSGEVVWGTVENSLNDKAASIQEAVKNGLAGQELASFISAKTSDITEILSALPLKTAPEVDTNLIQNAGLSQPNVSASFFSAANSSLLTDLGSVRQFISAMEQSFTGAQNLALANSMNTMAEDATKNGMSQIYNSLAASGANVSYDSQGNLVVTQSIYNGQANLREGADATSAASYDAGMSNYSTVVVAPESMKLASTGDLFSAWDNSTIFNDFQSNSTQFSSSFNQVASTMTARLNEVGKMNESGAEAYQASANSQANTAQMVKSLAETLASGGTVQSWAKSQAEGYVKSQVAQAISNATGGAVSADLIVAFLNKRQADKAKKEAARKKTIQVVQTVVAVVAAVVITVCTVGVGAPAGAAVATAGTATAAGGTAAAGTAVAAGSTAAAAGGAAAGGAAVAGGTAAAAGGFAAAAGSVVSTVASAISAVGTFVTATLPAMIVNIPTMVMTGVNAVLASTPAMIAVGVNTAVQTAAGYELGGVNGALTGMVNGVAIAGTAGGVGFSLTENNGNFGVSLGAGVSGATAGISLSSSGTGSVGVGVGGAGNSGVGVNLNSNGEFSGSITVPFTPTAGFGATFGSGQPTQVNLVATTGNGTAVQVGTGGVTVSTTVGNATANVGVDLNGNVTGGATLVTGPTTNYGVSFGTGEPTLVTVNNGTTNAVLGPDGLTVNNTTGGATTTINVNADGEVTGNVTSGTAGVTYGVNFGTGQATTVVATDGTNNVQIGPDGATVTTLVNGVPTTVNVDSNGTVTGNVNVDGTVVGVGPNGVSVTTEINGEQVSVDSNGNTTINGSTPQEIIDSIDLTNPLTFGISQEDFADLTAGLAIDEVNGFIDFLNTYPADLAAIGLTGMLGAYLFTIGRRDEEEYEYEEDEEGYEEEEEESSEEEDYEEPSDPPAAGGNGDVVVTERETVNLAGDGKHSLPDSYNVTVAEFELSPAQLEKLANMKADILAFTVKKKENIDSIAELNNSLVGPKNKLDTIKNNLQTKEDDLAKQMDDLRKSIPKLTENQIKNKLKKEIGEVTKLKKDLKNAKAEFYKVESKILLIKAEEMGMFKTLPLTSLQKAAFKDLFDEKGSSDRAINNNKAMAAFYLYDKKLLNIQPEDSFKNTRRVVDKVISTDQGQGKEEGKGFIRRIPLKGYSILMPGNPNDSVTSYPGPREDQVTSKPSWHSGFDVASTTGTIIGFPVDGKVVEVTNKDAKGEDLIRDVYGNSAYGQRVVIQAGESDYGFSISHNSKILVKVPEKVFAGQAVSISGDSGKSVGETGQHTHVEIMKKINGIWTTLSNPTVDDLKALEKLGLATKI